MKPNTGLIAIKTDHIFRMTDDTGMFQHAIYGVPNRAEGYTSDDNARALIMAVKLYAQHPGKKVEQLIYIYLSFLCNAQNDRGTFRNFMGYNRVFLEDEGSEDCFGRCMWALCFTYSNLITPQNVKDTAWSLIYKALPNWMTLVSPRAKGYLIIGLSYLNKEETNGIIKKLAGSLADQYDRCKDGDWHWFEENVTYCNAVLPWAMILAYKVTRKDRFEQIGFESLEFLESLTFSSGYFKPIGCKGWLKKGETPAAFDEQPVEACETMLAYIDAYKVSGNEKMLERAKTCFSWYCGKNSKNLSLIDFETGGCYDGIESDRINLNQGAESIVSFWVACVEMKKYMDADKQIRTVKEPKLLQSNVYVK